MGVDGGAGGMAGGLGQQELGPPVVAQDPMIHFRCTMCSLPEKDYKRSFIKRHTKETRDKQQKLDKDRAAKRQKERRAHGKPKKW